VTGFEEACVREQVATALEQAIEDGRLSPGRAGFRRRQAQVVHAALSEPVKDGDGCTRLQVVHGERLQRWLQRGNARGSEQRRMIIEPIAGLLAADSPVINRSAARAALAPALWLLKQANDGIALTQTGALNRALVREIAERWPGWWHAELFGPPNRQDELALLCELDELLRHLRLVRRTGRRIVTTARGRQLHADPAALLVALATELLAGVSFRAACAELAVALILDGFVTDNSNALADRIHPAIIAEGWQAAGEPPEPRDVGRTIADFLRPAEATGLLERKNSDSRLKPKPLILTDVGRAALISGLRARALAPSTGPY
jgi:hypothetical protein